MAENLQADTIAEGGTDAETTTRKTEHVELEKILSKSKCNWKEKTSKMDGK